MLDVGPAAPVPEDVFPAAGSGFAAPAGAVVPEEPPVEVADAGFDAEDGEAVEVPFAEEKEDEEVEEAEVEEEGVAALLRAPAGEAVEEVLLPAGLEPGSVDPGLPEAPVEEALAEEEPAGVAAPGFASTFSAVRSMVTGRFDDVEDEGGVAPCLSDAPLPPEDLLSVAICSPPEPCRFRAFRSQDLHYTHLVAKR